MESRGARGAGPEITGGEGEEPVECDDANLANKGGGPGGGDFWTGGGGVGCWGGSAFFLSSFFITCVYAFRPGLWQSERPHVSDHVGRTLPIIFPQNLNIRPDASL